MSEPDDAIRTEPETALRQMVESEGWAIFSAYARSLYGASAQMRDVKELLEELPTERHSFAMQNLLAVADDVMRLLAWPEEEADRLKTKAPRQPRDRFAKWRRVKEGATA